MNDYVSRQAVIDYLMINMGWHDEDDREIDDRDEKKPIITDLINGVPSGWISVKDRMPPNADHPGAFCPRYLVNTKYGITEGWYNPDKACWYTLVWFLIGRYDEDDIDIERGDIPKVSKTIEVTHWMPMPEPPNELNR